MTASGLYGPDTADRLPPEVQEIGAGAFITGVAQALFGTKSGLATLGLSEYRLPATA
ncbi:hypothetical protein [Roseospira goensis]|uniref:Uncharacterized protein n=1 Tax=Roseospira goensis TaxID=391922 RepID=A0A7W6RYS8_9PROT|nr:hypothetical protein [Roseospira goensis]MBB4285027.1 hypothetical protein [Roseospira goensis]